MKTFDIAIKYLQASSINFKNFDIYDKDALKDSTPAKKANIEQAQAVCEKYLADPQNTQSNDYYRRVIFETALQHLCFKEQGAISFWDKAIEIINANKKAYDLPFEKYKNTAHPKVMVEKYLEWCNSLNPQPYTLSEESEINLEMFMAAYEYVIEPNRA